MIDIFKAAAQVLQRFRQNVGGLKNLCFAQPHQPKAVFALCSRVIENFLQISDFLLKNEIPETQTLDYFLVLVLLYELKVNKLPDRRRPKSAETRAIIQKIKNTDLIKAEFDVVGAVQKQEVKRSYCYRVNFPFKENAEKLRSLFQEKGIQYEEDQVFSGLLIANVSLQSEFADIQSRASCLPVFALLDIIERSGKNPKQMTLLDLCAAPGSKTIQAAQYFRQVIAVERDQKRFKGLQKRCSKYENIQSINDDAFNVLKQCQVKFDAILLDPSCSGSGMFNNQDAKLGSAIGSAKSRASQAELAEFQTKLLHSAIASALATKCQFVSYSTCSIYQEENENVVSTVDQSYLVDALPVWKHRSLTMSKCLVAGSEANTDGFFVALFKL